MDAAGCGRAWRRMMNLLVGGALGGHLGGWRHRASPSTAMQLDCMVDIAILAEQGGLDAMFLADGNGVRQMDKPALFAANSPSDRPAVFDPVTVFAALSQHTRQLSTAFRLGV